MCRPADFCRLLTAAVVSEWLRSQTRNLMGSPRTGSNPVGCEIFLLFDESNRKHLEKTLLIHSDYIFVIGYNLYVSIHCIVSIPPQHWVTESQIYRVNVNWRIHFNKYWTHLLKVKRGCDGVVMLKLIERWIFYSPQLQCFWMFAQLIVRPRWRRKRNGRHRGQ